MTAGYTLSTPALGPCVADGKHPVRIRNRAVPELILSLREREIARFPITAVRTTIGRDATSDVVIDNAGVSRLHAVIEAVEDIFVISDSDSQNGITLNGESCRQGQLSHGDVIGVNKFLLRFSNESLEVPTGLQTCSEKPKAARPKDVHQTLLLDEGSVDAFAEVAKQQIARQRAALAARGGESLGPPSDSEPPASNITSDPPSTPPAKRSNRMLVGGLLVGGAALAAAVAFAL